MGLKRSISLALLLSSIIAALLVDIISCDENYLTKQEGETMAVMANARPRQNLHVKVKKTNRPIIVTHHHHYHKPTILLLNDGKGQNIANAKNLIHGGMQVFPENHPIASNILRKHLSANNTGDFLRSAETDGAHSPMAHAVPGQQMHPMGYGQIQNHGEPNHLVPLDRHRQLALAPNHANHNHVFARPILHPKGPPVPPSKPHRATPVQLNDYVGNRQASESLLSNYRKAGITNGNRNERYVDNGQSQTYSNGSKYGASADQNNGLNSPMARVPPNNKIGNKQKVQNTGSGSKRLQHTQSQTSGKTGSLKRTLPRIYSPSPSDDEENFNDDFEQDVKGNKNINRLDKNKKRPKIEEVERTAYGDGDD